MWMGGLRIFGTENRIVQKPTMKERAAKVFAKYHERALERMKIPRTKMGIFMMLILAKRAQKSEEKTEVKKGLDELGKRINRKEMRAHPVGINQDARGWFDRCGRPRYPVTTGRSAVHSFEGENQKP